MEAQHAARRSELAAATRILAAHNLIGMFGHVSVLPDEDGADYLLSPGAGFVKSRCRPEDVFALGFDDEWRPGLPLEIYMHSEAHRISPQVGAFVHTHSPALTALSTMNPVPGESLLLHSTFWPDQVPIFELQHLVTDRSDAAELVDVLGEQSVVLMRWHGAVIAGRTLQEAVFRAIYAERNAELLLRSLQDPRPASVPLPGGAARTEIADQVLTERMLALHWSYETIAAPAPGATSEVVAT